MAHLLYTPEQAARATLAVLRWVSLLPRTVRQDFANEFVAGRGQTVNVKGPITAGKAHVYTPHDREERNQIEFNELAQKWFPVTLEDQAYNAVRLPDDFATFTIQSLTTEVLRPQAESVVDELAEPLINEMTAIDTDELIPAIAPNGSNIRTALIKARQVLNDRRDADGRHIPAAGRVVVLGSSLEAAALQDEQLQKVNESGTASVLREATIGKLFGFTILTDPSLPSDFGIAYHKDAFAHVTRPSKKPEGAAYSSTVAQDGFALRWIQQYNPLQLEDQSVVDTFYGASTLDANRAVALTLSEPVEPEDE